MNEWIEYSGPPVPPGVLVLQREHDTRRAMVSVTPMPDGTTVLSLTISIAASLELAKRVGERLLRHNADDAVPK